MSAPQRRLLGLLVAIALMVGCGAYTWWRMAAVGREGWAGLAYMPDVKTKSGKPIPVFGAYHPGAIFIVYPGSPAERAGIERMQRLVSINGTPIRDVDRITRVAEGVHRGDVVVYRTETNG